MAITPETAWADVKARVSNVGDIDSTQQLRLANIVNEEIRDVMMDSDPERLITTTSISITTPPSSVSIPSDMLTMEAEGCGIFRVDDNGNDTDEQLPISGFGSTFNGYYLDSANINFTGATITGTYKLRYIPEATELTATTDSFIVPNRNKYRELVRLGLLVQYYQAKGEFKDSEYGNWNGEYIARLEEFANQVRRQTGSVNMIDTTNSYG